MKTYKVTLQDVAGGKRIIYIKGTSQSSALRSDEFMSKYIAGERIISCELAKALKKFEIIIKNYNSTYTSLDITASTKSEAISIVESEMPLLSQIVEVNEIVRRNQHECK